MKKFLALILAVLMIVACFAGCSSKETLVVGYTIYEPMNYLDENGKLIGYDTELAEKVFGNLGYNVVFKEIKWENKYTDLNSGAIDCIWNGFTMNGREELYTWTGAYCDNSQVFVTRAADGLATFADLAGKVVTVQADSSCEAALNDEENPDAIALRDSFASLEQCAEYNTAFMELESGAVDAIGMDIGVARFQIEGREDQFVIMEQPLQSEQYGVGFKLGNTELRDQVEETLLEMVEDGTFAKISEEWFGYDVCVLGK